MTTYAGLPGVIMPVPPDWEDRSQLIVVSRYGGDFRPNIVIVSEPQRNETLQEFASRHLVTLQDTFENFVVVFDAPVTLGPYRGHLRDYRFIAGDRAYQQRQFHTIAGGLVYTFTYSDLEENFTSGMSTLEAVVGNTLLPHDDDLVAG
jgi:hypothetical protein